MHIKGIKLNTNSNFKSELEGRERETEGQSL